MTLLQRTNAIVSANLHDFVDQFEEPHRMLRHSLRELEALLETTAATAARSLAAERMLKNSRDAELRQIETWKSRAKTAIDSGDEVMARRAIARQIDHQRACDTLDIQLSHAQEANATLRRQLESLRDKYAASQGRLAVLVASQAAAEARRDLYSSTSSALGSSRAIARFEHFSRKLEFAQAEAAALVDLDTVGEDALEQEIIGRETQAAIDEELLRLKQSRD